MPQYQAVLELGDLDGNNGFRFHGAAAGDFSGRSASSAGDVNGDGIHDFLIGASTADTSALDSGAAYIVCGRIGLEGVHVLSELDGTNGFRIAARARAMRSGGRFHLSETSIEMASTTLSSAPGL
jgi:hypothetical protein